MILPDDDAKHRYFRDEAEIRDTHWKIHKGDVVIDIGANFGSYALPALLAGAKHVIAVDSDLSALDVFESICKANGIRKSRYTVLNAAVGKQYPRELMEAIPEYMRPIGCAWLSLDSVALGLKRCDWVKIDVEGGELGVLQSGTGLLENLKPRLLIEDHTDIYPWVAKNHSAERIDALLTRKGYTWDKVHYEGADGPRPYWITHA